MLKLAKTEITPVMQQRVIRIMNDVRMIAGLTTAEIRAIYPELEAARDALSLLLDKADGKHV